MKTRIPKPIIVIDSREQKPLSFEFPSRVATLQTGDYSFAGAEELFAVERKSIQDLVGCCSGANRERFERELHRLRGFHFKRLLIVGHEVEIKTGRYRSGIAPAAVLATLGCFEVRYDTPVIFEPTPEAAARRIENWAHWFSRELLKTVQALSVAAESSSNTEPFDAVNVFATVNQP